MAIVSITVPIYDGEGAYAHLILEGYVDVLVNGTPLKAEFVNNRYGIYKKVEPIKIDNAITNTITVRNNKAGEVFNLETIDFKEYQPKTISPDLLEWDVTPDNYSSMVKHNRAYFLPFLEFKVRTTAPVEDYPFLKIYKVDDDNLKTLSNEVEERVGKIEKGSTDNIIKSYDVTGHIVNLLRIPYPIEVEDELIQISMKNDAMKSQGKPITNYLQTIELGSVTCGHDVLKGIGYKNIEFNLFVPNFKPISLDVAKVIDRKVDIKLIIDLTTGTGTLNLSMNGAVFKVESNTIAKDIPFRSDNINVSLKSDVLDVDFINPYLEINVLNPNNAINLNQLKQRDINKSSYKYLKTDHIFLNTRANYLEQLELEALIRKGVFING